MFRDLSVKSIVIPPANTGTTAISSAAVQVVVLPVSPVGVLSLGVGHSAWDTMGSMRYFLGMGYGLISSMSRLAGMGYYLGTAIWGWRGMVS